MTTTTADRPLPVSTALGTVLQSRMWQARVSQTAAARALGKQPASMGKKLRGDVPITSDELIVLARLVDADPAELLREAINICGC